MQAQNCEPKPRLGAFEAEMMLYVASASALKTCMWGGQQNATCGWQPLPQQLRLDQLHGEWALLSCVQLPCEQMLMPCHVPHAVLQQMHVLWGAACDVVLAVRLPPMPA